MSEFGAFLGMLFGFLGCAIPKAVGALANFTFPICLDPFFIGVVCSVIGIVVGSKLKPATEYECSIYEEMHIRPKEEISEIEDKKTNRLKWVYIGFGILLGAFFVFAYAIPYINAIN